MGKIPEINPDSFRKKLIQAERSKCLDGKGKSNTWREVKQMALNNRQRRNAKVDQEIALYLPFLNFREKRVLLSLVKVLVPKQDKYYRQLYREVPGVVMTQVIASPPHLVMENSAKIMSQKGSRLKK
jgi:hypothetical protein